MILIVTNRDDHTADWLILELQEREVDYFRLNTEDFPGAARLHWTSAGDALLHFKHRTVDLSTVTAVSYRRPVPPDPSLWPSLDRARWAIGETRATLDGLWRTLDALWVNHPDDNRRAGSKLEQLRRAQRLGFVVPDTLVTNDRASVRGFTQGLAGAAICKPVDDGLLELDEGSAVFFTSPLELHSDDPLDDFGPEPYLFQRLVKKSYDVRVTVIGDAVFATRIESQETETGRTDWRRAGASATHTPERLPHELANRCLALTRSYGLQFSAIDLAAVADGYVFFEINPNGQWAWIEQLTGEPLRAAMADLLIGTAA